MHYYKFNIGDYASHTTHLDPLEDIAYRRMLDWVYLHESPLPDNVEQIARLIRMRTHCECIETVLREFFELSEYGWIQEKAFNEIRSYKEKSEKAKKSAMERWSKKPNKSDANALRKKSEGNANHKPLTTNQEPETNNQYKHAFGEIIDYLNKATGRKFSTSRELEARVKEYKPEDIKRVIDYKSKQWMGTDMQTYLRPQTLFNKTKFEGYWNDAMQQVPTTTKKQDNFQGSVDVLQNLDLNNQERIGESHG